MTVAKPHAATLWNKQVGFRSVCLVASVMSGQRQSASLHFDRTLNARTRTWLPRRQAEKQIIQPCFFLEGCKNLQG